MDNTSSYKSIGVNEMDSLLDTVEVIDIREPYEFREGSLRNAINIPMGELLANPDSFLEEGKTYYILCRSGMRSRNTCQMLTAQGYDVIDVIGGMIGYTKKSKITLE